jgi:hypothetical protein
MYLLPLMVSLEEVANNAFDELTDVADNALFEYFSCKYLDCH